MSDGAVSVNVTVGGIVKTAQAAGETVTLTIDGEMEIAKADTVKQNVFGWAIVAKKADGTEVEDQQEDLLDVEDLEDAAYTFMKEWRGSGDSHDGQPPTGEVIESVVFTPEKMAKMKIPEGVLPEAWWLGVHLPDRADFDKVVKGERSMFSIEGTAIREPV